MEYLVGISLALLVGLFATITGFDRDRAFYPTVTVVVASYYELFAVMGGSATALKLETLVFAGFLVVSVIGFRTSHWLIVIALAGHGLFDLMHPDLISDPGVPAWWPNFCLSYDVAAAIYLAARLGPQTLMYLRGPLAADVQREFRSADGLAQEGDFAAAFRHLERAHVLGQGSTYQHVRVHWRMLLWGMGRRDTREIAGQALRIVGAATKTPFGLLPRGNTGGANVSPFKAMPISPDLAAIMAERSR